MATMRPQPATDAIASATVVNPVIALGAVTPTLFVFGNVTVLIHPTRLQAPNDPELMRAGRRLAFDTGRKNSTGEQSVHHHAEVVRPCNPQFRGGARFAQSLTLRPWIAATLENGNPTTVVNGSMQGSSLVSSVTSSLSGSAIAIASKERAAK